MDPFRRLDLGFVQTSGYLRRVRNEPGLPQAVPRRGFVKIFALLSASALVGGRSWLRTLFGELKASPAAFPAAVLQLRLADFPALQKDYGSVRIGTSAVGPAQFPLGLFYPVVVNRAPGNQFYALSAECTHAGCVVPALNATTKYSRCPCHGSRFGIDGSLLEGPANSPLQRFPISFDGQATLTIQFPVADVQGMDGFSLEVSKVSAPADRVAIRFLSYQGIQYEMKYRASIADAWKTVPFALSSASALDQTVLAGTDDYITLFAEAGGVGGLFAVAMKTSVV